MHRSQTKHNGVGCAKTPAAILRSQQAIRWSSSTGGAMSGGGGLIPDAASSISSRKVQLRIARTLLQHVWTPHHDAITKEEQDRKDRVELSLGLMVAGTDCYDTSAIPIQVSRRFNAGH
jgi:hypothetical protein